MNAIQQMLRCLKTGISGCLGLWKASAEEMPCYSTPYILAERGRERERGRGVRREGGREGRRGVGSWSYRLQYKKFDFHSLFQGIYAIGSVETPHPMGVS